MRAAEKNGDPRRKAARPKEHHPRVYAPVVPWPARTRAARRATAVSYHIVRAVWETAPPRDRGREKERKREREGERGTVVRGRGKAARGRKEEEGATSNAAE